MSNARFTRQIIMTYRRLPSTLDQFARDVGSTDPRTSTADHHADRADLTTSSSPIGRHHPGLFPVTSKMPNVASDIGPTWG